MASFYILGEPFCSGSDLFEHLLTSTVTVTEMVSQNQTSNCGCDHHVVMAFGIPLWYKCALNFILKRDSFFRQLLQDMHAGA